MRLSRAAKPRAMSATRADFGSPQLPSCPICYDIIKEPVVYPCTHEVCRECFERSVETASFHCPLCRKRVSSWARRHRGDPVDRKRKRQLEDWLGLGECTQDEQSTSPHPILSAPGEIMKEYVAEIEKISLEQIEEEKMGEQEARRIQDEEYRLKIQLAVEAEEGKREAQRLQEEEENIQMVNQALLEEDHKLAEALAREQAASRKPLIQRTPQRPTLKKPRAAIRKETPLSSLPMLPLSNWMSKTPKRSTSSCEDLYSKGVCNVSPQHVNPLKASGNPLRASCSDTRASFNEKENITVSDDVATPLRDEMTTLSNSSVGANSDVAAQSLGSFKKSNYQVDRDTVQSPTSIVDCYLSPQISNSVFPLAAMHTNSQPLEGATLNDKHATDSVSVAVDSKITGLLRLSSGKRLCGNHDESKSVLHSAMHSTVKSKRRHQSTVKRFLKSQQVQTSSLSILDFLSASARGSESIG